MIIDTIKVWAKSKKYVIMLFYVFIWGLTASVIKRITGYDADFISGYGSGLIVMYFLNKK